MKQLPTCLSPDFRASCVHAIHLAFLTHASRHATTVAELIFSNVFASPPRQADMKVGRDANDVTAPSSGWGYSKPQLALVHLRPTLDDDVDDDDDDADDDDDDDEKDDIAESYGNTGAFSAEINYSTDVTVQASAIDNWKIVDAQGVALGKPLVAFADTTITLATDGDGGDDGVDQEATTTTTTTTSSLTTNADDAFENAFGNTASEDPFADASVTSVVSNEDPFADSGGSESEGVTVQSLKFSETISFDKITDTSTPKDPSEGWAPFGATQTQTQTLTSATDAVADAVMTSVMSQVNSMEDVSDATDEKSNDDNNNDDDDDRDDPLPELPDSTTTSPAKTVLVIDGTTDNIETDSSTDDVDVEVPGNGVLDIEGGGHLFGSAV
eukprot:m.201735 g.201735  ORF g.201735 m.201735 type:complete len:384 (+) comp32804_c7_seq4:1153-2304(+)